MQLLIAERYESKWWHKRFKSMICCVKLQDRTRSLKICKNRLKNIIIFDLLWLFKLRVLWLFLQCIEKIRMSLLQLKHALLWYHLHSCCYDSSYASMLIAMLMTMLMTMFLTIVDRSSLDYQVVSKSTLFRVSLCSSESYR